MKRALGLLACISVVALGTSASAASADDRGPVENIPNARAAIEALPYPFSFRSPPRYTRNSLIIKITDELGRTFRFFLFVDRAPREIGVPGYHRDNLSGGALGRRYVFFSNEARETRPETTSLPIRSYKGDSEITRAMEEEFYEIEFAVEDSICELSEGKPCPVF